MTGWYLHSSKITRTGAVLMVCAVFSMQLACRTDISDRPQDGDTDSGAGDMSAMVDAGDMLERMDLATEPDLALDLAAPEEDMRGADLGLDMATVEDMAGDMQGEDMTPPEDMSGVVPLRQVVSRGLMGSMELANYVKDPDFTTLYEEYTWISTNNRGSSFRVAYRHVPAVTPEGSASLRIPKSDGDDVLLYGEVLFHPSRSLKMSVWIGRKGFIFGGTDTPASVQTVGLNIQDLRNFSVDLLPVDGSLQIIDGYHWTRYEAMVQGFAGYGYIIVQDDSSRDLYVHAPKVVEVVPSPSGALPPPAPMQVLDEEANSKLTSIYDYVRERRSIPRGVGSEGPNPHPF